MIAAGRAIGGISTDLGRIREAQERGDKSDLTNLGLGANLLRYKSAADNIANTLPHLGKSLTNHQVVPAVNALSANSPLTDIGKVVLSGTGGNPARIADRVFGIHKTTMKLSPNEKRNIVKAGLSKVSPHASSIVGLL